MSRRYTIYYPFEKVYALKMFCGDSGCLYRHRARFHPDSEANTLYVDTHQVKNAALHASYAKLYVITLMVEHKRHADTSPRSAPHKPLRSKPKSVKMAAGEQPVTTLI